MPPNITVTDLRMTRRQLLTAIGIGSLAVAAVACGSESSTTTDEALPTGASGDIGTGGRARLAFAGSGATESLDPLGAPSAVDYARRISIFDPLFAFHDATPEPRLATGVTYEGDDLVIALREGVTFHDGSTLTSADVVFTFSRFAGPANVYPSDLLMYFDFAKARADGPLTVRVPVRGRRIGWPEAALASDSLQIVKAGTTTFTTTSTIGTGPYALSKFAPGEQTVLKRFDEYWAGPANVDELVLLSLPEPGARVNAVKTKVVDYAAEVPFATAMQATSTSGIQVRTSPDNLRGSYCFAINMSRDLGKQEAFRKALRLGIDRQALVDTIMLGHGEPGNDLVGAGAKYYLDASVPKRDTDRARTLLEEAGAIGKQFRIRCFNYEVGLVDSAKLFASQLRDLGLDATVNEVTMTEAFDMKSLAADDASAFPIGAFNLPTCYGLSQSFPPLAFHDKEFGQALDRALHETTDGGRRTAWEAAQQIAADRGNWIVWGRADTLAIAADNFGGIVERESPKYPWLGKVGFVH
ncbi:MULTISPECIES: ABC transporter substrate-binding protein [Gordonia]|uniref:ABC transporter substrate-binding protein n=1 Tax=Gordonia TaxID=2053 RepID=UPI0019CBF518|nr:MULTISPECIES: ABC transporter substrate-binding protein [Gordonia]MBD0020742.1 ABC transporter substrate-binding protein [Gordonia sp. (in: high G+C Gram-positive bacteria)]